MTDHSLFPSLIFTFAVVATAVAAAAPETTNNTDFIRSSCGATLYPDLCYTTLSGYAGAVQTSPSELAHVAVSVALLRSARVASLARRSAARSPALRDCAYVLSEATNQMRRSISELRRAAGKRPLGEEAFRFAMANVETWMSAALTDEETCTDGLAEGGTASPAAAAAAGDICRRMSDVKEVTSNALALVNKFASSGGTVKS